MVFGKSNCHSLVKKTFSNNIFFVDFRVTVGFPSFFKVYAMDGLNGRRGARVDRGMVWAMGPYGPYLVRPPLYPAPPSIWTPAPPQPPLLLPPSPSGPNSIVPTGTSQGRVCALCGGAGGHQCVSEYKGAPFYTSFVGKLSILVLISRS